MVPPVADLVKAAFLSHSYDATLYSTPILQLHAEAPSRVEGRGRHSPGLCPSARCFSKDSRRKTFAGDQERLLEAQSEAVARHFAYEAKDSRWWGATKWRCKSHQRQGQIRLFELGKQLDPGAEL